MTDWFEEHRGPLVRTVGRVWDCGDDECGCTRPEILNVYRNRVVPNFYVSELVWEGTFRTDHEPGADEELAAKRAELAVLDPSLHGRVEW